MPNKHNQQVSYIVCLKVTSAVKIEKEQQIKRKSGQGKGLSL